MQKFSLLFCRLHRQRRESWRNRISRDHSSRTSRLHRITFQCSLRVGLGFRVQLTFSQKRTLTRPYSVDLHLRRKQSEDILAPSADPFPTRPIFWIKCNNKLFATAKFAARIHTCTFSLTDTYPKNMSGVTPKRKTVRKSWFARVSHGEHPRCSG